VRAVKVHFAAGSGTSNPMNKPHADFEAPNHGTIFLIRPTSEAGSDHFAELDPWHHTFFGQSLAVEHRYTPEVVERLAESFTVTTT
jgi:hypothetical protein